MPLERPRLDGSRAFGALVKQPIHDTLFLREPEDDGASKRCAVGWRLLWMRAKFIVAGLRRGI